MSVNTAVVAMTFSNSMKQVQKRGHHLKGYIVEHHNLLHGSCLFDLGEENGSQQLKFKFGFRIEVPKMSNKRRKLHFLKRLHHFSEVFLKKLHV